MAGYGVGVKPGRGVQKLPGPFDSGSFRLAAWMWGREIPHHRARGPAYQPCKGIITCMFDNVNMLL